MLNVNKQLTQSLRTINIILFVRLQRCDGMAWISIFKPVSLVCVSKRFEPIWSESCLCAPPVERPAGEPKSWRSLTEGSADWKRSCIRLELTRSAAAQVSGVCACPAGASSRSLRHLFCFMRLFWKQRFTCVSPSCRALRRPPPAWPGSGTCWSGTPSPARSAPWCRSQSSGAHWPCDRPRTRCCWAPRSGASWLETGHQKIRSMGWSRIYAQDPSE